MHHKIKDNWVGGLPWGERYSIARAAKAYRLRCARKGFIPRQPCRGLSSVECNTIMLRSCNGELARFTVTSKGLRPADAGIPGKDMERQRSIALSVINANGGSNHG